MSGRRRRQSRRRYEIDLSNFSEGIFISKEYKSRALVVVSACLAGMFLGGTAFGYLLSNMKD